MPQIYDMGPTALLSLRKIACWGIFRPKNPMNSAGFEPANLGVKASTIPLDHRSRYSLYIRKEMFREFGRNIFCLKIRVNTSGLVLISNIIDGIVTGNSLVVSWRCFKLCSAPTVAEKTICIVLHLAVSVCTSLRKDDEKRFRKIILYFYNVPWMENGLNSGSWSQRPNCLSTELGIWNVRFTEINWESRQTYSLQDYLTSVNDAASKSLYNLMDKINYGLLIGNGII